jgi:hypothetical protein
MDLENRAALLLSSPNRSTGHHKELALSRGSKEFRCPPPVVQLLNILPPNPQQFWAGVDVTGG